MHNIKLLVIAVVLSLSCVYLIKHPGFFVSSVLNLQEIQEIETKQWDIAYKTDNQLLDVFLPLSGSQKSPVTISVAYNPSSIIVDMTKASSQAPYTIKTQQSGSFSLEFIDISHIDPHQSLFYVPFSGTSQQILIEDASGLSIGKLSSTLVHGN
ncbi:MAG: hypothetical protein WCO66_04975 [Candidatus Absconditabacteria bacterium]